MWVSRASRALDTLTLSFRLPRRELLIGATPCLARNYLDRTQQEDSNGREGPEFALPVAEIKNGESSIIYGAPYIRRSTVTTNAWPRKKYNLSL